MSYTRYADDLTFSSRNFITDKIKDAIIDIIKEAGFQINPKKIRFQSNNMCQYVTGIKVNEKLNIDRRYIRNVRAILHDWKLNGLEKASVKMTGGISDGNDEYFLRSLFSRIVFIESVRGEDDKICDKLKIQFNELSKRDVYFIDK